jgi:hypothetical protein
MWLPRASGEIFAGRYRILSLLGKGGFGAVYDAERTDGGGRVALKLLHARHTTRGVEYKRFQREAAVLQRLRHPNVVEILDFGHSDEGLPYIAFELLVGVALAEELRASAMPLGRATDIARQVTRALVAAHAMGVVHRDVKPANIFLGAASGPAPGDGGGVKVLDFGIAKALEGDTTMAGTLTATGQMVGTPYYMSPEQVRGGEVDERADQYSLGAVISEMVSGERLVRGESEIEVYMVHIGDAPLALPAAVGDSPLGPIVARAVSKRPEHRFASAAALLEALEQVYAEMAKADLGATLPIDGVRALALGATAGLTGQATAATAYSIESPEAATQPVERTARGGFAAPPALGTRGSTAQRWPPRAPSPPPGSGPALPLRTEVLRATDDERPPEAEPSAPYVQAVAAAPIPSSPRVLGPAAPGWNAPGGAFAGPSPRSVPMQSAAPARTGAPTGGSGVASGGRGPAVFVLIGVAIALSVIAGAAVGAWLWLERSRPAAERAGATGPAGPMPGAEGPGPQPLRYPGMTVLTAADLRKRIVAAGYRIVRESEGASSGMLELRVFTVLRGQDGGGVQLMRYGSEVHARAVGEAIAKQGEAAVASEAGTIVVVAFPDRRAARELLDELLRAR